MVVVFEVRDEDRGLNLAEMMVKAQQEKRCFASRRGYSDAYLIMKGENAAKHQSVVEAADWIARKVFPVGQS